MAEKKYVKRAWRRMMPVVVPPIGELLIRAIWLTVKKEVHGFWALWEEMDAGRGVIIAFWHGRMLLLPPFYERYLKREAHVLISQHRDGELIARAISGFGLESIRGSSRRGGRDAMEEMKRRIREGVIIGITPDGPRGPGEKARRGTIELAHLTGAPVFPLSYAASHQKKLSSWDRFVIPAPFSKVVFVLGDPIRLRGDEGLKGRQELTVLLEKRLIEAGIEAERLAGWK